MKRILCLLALIPILLLSGCNRAGYVQTEQTEQALEAYYAAVRECTAQTKGTVKVSIHMKDTVVSKAESDQHYEYSYTVADGKEDFEYICSDGQGNKTAHVIAKDGTVIDQLTGADTKAYDGYLKHQNNPISTLQLFRMDANYKVQDSTIASIVSETQGEETVITVTFHADKLTGLAIKNQGGLYRTVTSHQRIYTLRDGKIAKIEIHDRENAKYKGETGVMNTDTIVEVSY